MFSLNQNITPHPSGLTESGLIVIIFLVLTMVSKLFNEEFLFFILLFSLSIHSIRFFAAIIQVKCESYDISSKQVVIRLKLVKTHSQIVQIQEIGSVESSQNIIQKFFNVGDVLVFKKNLSSDKDIVCPVNELIVLSNVREFKEISAMILKNIQ
jgi:uncharacterized membrane protein YdbT with pleckstrin-like domain